MVSKTILQLQASESKVLENLNFPKQPLRTLTTGQLYWSQDQVILPEQIHLGDVLVRVCGDDRVRETILVLKEPYQRNGSWWFGAVRYSNMSLLIEFSLGDAGVIRGVAGWSSNYLITSGFCVEPAELAEIASQATPLNPIMAVI
jgi:hypothetical protein